MRRRHYFLLALLFIGIAVYGSWVPFSYQPLTFREAVEQFSKLSYRSFSHGGRADFAANVLLYIPIGCFLLGFFLVDRRSLGLAALAVPVVVSLSVALSVTVEFSQLWFPPRVASWNDVLAHAAGTVTGVGLWLAGGQAITDWLRSLSLSARPKSRVEWFLQAYVVGLVIYSVQPLDLSISVTDLVHKYREGRIHVLPFSDLGAGSVALWGLLRQAALFVPVGMLAATWRTPREPPVRRITTSVLLGGAVVLAIELAKLLVSSSTAATDDVIAGTLGVLVGAFLVRRWRWSHGHPADHPPPAPSEDARMLPARSDSARRAWRWLGLAGAYALLLFVIFSTPVEVVDDPGQMRVRYEGFYGVPFARLRHGSQLDAVVEVATKVLLWAPLGAMFSLAVEGLCVPAAIRRMLLAALLVVAAGIGVSMEMAQVFLLPHVPDLTDVILYTAGTAAGMLFTLRVARPRQTPE